MIGTIWSTSSGVNAIIDTLNQAYDIPESRPWWKVKAIALGLTVALAVFIVLSFALVLVGPTLAEKVAVWMHLGAAFAWTWKILQWPLVFALVALAIALIYYFAPDAEQDWVWITPGSVFATILWVVISLAFKFYVAHFGSYNATYGTIGGIIVLMTWMYVSSLAVLVGAELNAEIEHASPYGKDPGERLRAKRSDRPGGRARVARPAAGRRVRPGDRRGNCDVDAISARRPARVTAAARQRLDCQRRGRRRSGRARLYEAEVDVPERAGVIRPRHRRRDGRRRSAIVIVLLRPRRPLGAIE